ncbi:DsbE family thiol:disulfide interchange protein [Mesorhizobium marinum]|uniref:DsbE family thiol:disulfide interchange protein n=1 Tax=Mesorhizobium marinum TaxID=3228790 RepID=UPI0034654029
MTAETASQKPRRLVVLLPLALFLGLAALFLVQLLSGRDVAEIPSALIGHPAPETNLAPLEGIDLPGLDSKAFAGKVTLVNVWASWCAPCREEHPLLVALSADKRFAVAGLNYKDKPENARRFLGSLGNPYSAIGVDGAGRAAIDWGVYGVPETFLVGRDGRILLKHVGPLDQKAVTAMLLPAIEKALAANEPPAP